MQISFSTSEYHCANILLKTELEDKKKLKTELEDAKKEMQLIFALDQNRCLIDRIPFLLTVYLKPLILCSESCHQRYLIFTATSELSFTLGRFIPLHNHLYLTAEKCGQQCDRIHWPKPCDWLVIADVIHQGVKSQLQ